MSNNKSDECDLQAPLLGGSTATADNDDSLINPFLNRLFESVSRNMKTIILSAKNRADLKNKLLPWSVEGGQSEEFLQSLPKNIRKRVEVLLKIQGQHDKLKANFFKEMAALEAKYQKIYAPLYKKRFDIVNGVLEVQGLSGIATVGKNGDTYIDIATENNKDGKGVPNFWLTAMMANEFLADEIQERDEEALKYLKDIKWSRFGKLKGFKLEFFFDANPYFKNTVLTKKFEMEDEEESILDMIGTEIKWLPGKNLTQEVVKKVPKKGSKNTKPITKTEECESFFNFFNPPQFPGSDDDDETAEDLQDQIEQDYAIGKTIREEIIPHAVSWFTRGIDEEY